MLIDLIKSFVIGLVEGITEWLPISSSTHIELASDLMKTDYAPSFFAFFEVVIQLGAILAVILVYWKRLWTTGARSISEAFTSARRRSSSTAFSLS